MSKVKDLTKGNVAGQIFSFALPVMLGALFQQFYNVVDTAIVGKILGEDALAAVGATGSIMFMILGFCNGLCAGFAIPVANRFGAGDERGLRRAVSNCLWLGALMSVIITLVTVLGCHGILRIMNTPSNIVDMSYAYLIVIFYGIPVTIFYNLLSGIIRALGDSKTPLYFLIFSSAINIVLDIICISYLGLGTGGAGIATVVAQLISAILCAIYMIKKYPILHMKEDEWKPRSAEMGQLLGAGVPMGLQYSITAIGSIILQTSVNGLGSSYVAAMTSGGKISLFTMCPFDALGSAIATFTGQNMGAGKIERVDEGLKKSMLGGTVYAVFGFIMLYTFGKKFALIFVSAQSTELIANIHTFLIYNSICYVFLLGVDVIRSVIQGMGFSRLAIISGIMEMFARGLMGMFVVPKLGFKFACMASPLAWIMACVFLVPAYIYVRNASRKRLGLVKNE